jgi:hypothetical protein
MKALNKFRQASPKEIQSETRLGANGILKIHSPLDPLHFHKQVTLEIINRPSQGTRINS